MPIVKEISSMLELSRNRKNSFSVNNPILMNVLYRNKEVYPQIDTPFQCIDIYNHKASVALWVHPLKVAYSYVKKEKTSTSYFYITCTLNLYVHCTLLSDCFQARFILVLVNIIHNMIHWPHLGVYT